MKKILLIASIFISSFSFAQNYHRDSLNFTYLPQYWGFADSLIGFGHSIMAGQNGDGTTVLDSSFFYLYYRAIRDSGYDHGIGGTGSIDAYMVASRYFSNPHKAMTWVLDGRNEFAGTNITATYNKVLNCEKSLFALAMTKYFVSARTSTAAIRFGTWSNYTNTANSNYFETRSHEGTTTTTINDSITYDFIYPDSTLFIQLIATSTSSTLAQVFIDGVSQGTFNTNGAADGNSRDVFLTGGTKTPYCLIFNGLTLASHHVKVVNTTAATLIVDGFGHLMDSRFSFPFVIMHDIGYGVSGSSGTAGDSLVHLNVKRDSMVATVPFAYYHATTFPTNTYWTQATDIGADGIHPNNTGYRHVFNGMVAFSKTFWPRPEMGTIINVGGGFHIRIAQDTNQFAFRRLITQGDILPSTGYIPTTFNFPIAVNTNKYDITFNGNGPAGTGGGSKLRAQNISLEDSTSAYLFGNPSKFNTNRMGIRFKDEGSGGYSNSVGSNIGAFFQAVENTHTGAGLYFDSRGTTNPTAPLLGYIHYPGVSTQQIWMRLWTRSASTWTWQFGDSALPGNYPVYITGTEGIRIPLGTVAQRPTGQGGGIRIEADSLGRFELNSNNKYQVNAFLQDVWGLVTATDANFTTANGVPQYILPAITAGRTVTIAAAERPGQKIEFKVTNTSGNAWTFATTVKDLAGNTITALPNGSTARLTWDGSQWNKDGQDPLALGYNVGSSIQSGNGSSTSFTIAHGLSGVSSTSNVVLTARSSAAAGFAYVTTDATNITITYTVAPTTGTNNLTWSYILKP